MSYSIDLRFALLADAPIPADHGYLLYSAVSRMMPELHAENDFGIHPIRGRQLGGRTLQLTEHSRLVIRTGADRIARFLPLAGGSLQLLDRYLRVGVPHVRPLTPAASIRSRLVTIKLAGGVHRDAEVASKAFVVALRRQLDTISVSADVQMHLGKRRTLRVKDKEVFGYEVFLDGLSASESITIQEHGLGGRRKMGCGVFIPVRREGAPE